MTFVPRMLGGSAPQTPRSDSSALDVFFETILKIFLSPRQFVWSNRELLTRPRRRDTATECPALVPFRSLPFHVPFRVFTFHLERMAFRSLSSHSVPQKGSKCRSVPFLDIPCHMGSFWDLMGDWGPWSPWGLVNETQRPW